MSKKKSPLKEGYKVLDTFDPCEHANDHVDGDGDDYKSDKLPPDPNAEYQD